MRFGGRICAETAAVFHFLKYTLCRDAPRIQERMPPYIMFCRTLRSDEKFHHGESVRVLESIVLRLLGCLIRQKSNDVVSL
jgi:hypothetical protein